MELFGVGVWEVVVVFILMLVVAGPKRMAVWAYEVGKYARKIRVMMQETMDAFNREIEAAGLDIQKDIPQVPQKFDVVGEVNKLISGEGESTPAASVEAPPSESTEAAPDNVRAQQRTDESKKPESDDKPRYDSWTPN